MTDATIALADMAELADKGPDVDMLRQKVQFMAQRLMDLDVESLCGSGYNERNAERLNSRNGFHDRSWETRAGTVALKIPKLRQGSYEGDWPYLWIDATYVKAREAGSVVSVAVIVAVAVNIDGQRQVIGMKTGPSEAETFWTEFLRSLMRRGLRGVRLVISDAHEGLKAAAAKVLKATWQRCRVHFMRNALAYANKTQRRMVSAAIATFFACETAKDAYEQWRTVADRFRDSLPKLAKMMDAAEHEVLSYMAFPRAHWLQIHSTNPLERLNAEIKRRTNVVGIFPNDAAITRLVGAMLLEQNDEWSLTRRYLQLEGLQSLSDTVPAMVPTVQR